jgi:hypothetical protein
MSTRPFWEDDETPAAAGGPRTGRRGHRRERRPCHRRHPVPAGGLDLDCGCRWTYTEGAWVKIIPCAAHPIRRPGAIEHDAARLQAAALWKW